jgi:hypothetical protein
MLNTSPDQLQLLADGRNIAGVNAKTGSKLSKLYVLGVEVDVVDIHGTLMLTRRGMRDLVQVTLEVTDRQARASVTSYMAEQWPVAGSGCRINDPFCAVTSGEARVLQQEGRRDELRKLRPV